MDEGLLPKLLQRQSGLKVPGAARIHTSSYLKVGLDMQPCGSHNCGCSSSSGSRRRCSDSGHHLLADLVDDVAQQGGCPVQFGAHAAGTDVNPEDGSARMLQLLLWGGHHRPGQHHGRGGGALQLLMVGTRVFLQLQLVLRKGAGEGRATLKKVLAHIAELVAAAAAKVKVLLGVGTRGLPLGSRRRDVEYP